MPSVPTPRARAARRTGVLALLALVLGVLSAPPAAAHNTLRSTDPADGSTVATAPAQVTLTFDQPAMDLGTQIVVTGPDGVVVSEGPVQLVDVSVVQPLAVALPAGAYTVDWRVTSADGHPLSGAFTFTTTEAVGAPAPADGPTAPAEPTQEPAASAEPSEEEADPADDTATVTVMPISAPADEGVPAWVWVLLGAGVVALLVGVGLVVARRRAADAEGSAAVPDDRQDGPTPSR